MLSEQIEKLTKDNMQKTSKIDKMKIMSEGYGKTIEENCQKIVEMNSLNKRAKFDADDLMTRFEIAERKIVRLQKFNKMNAAEESYY